MTEHYSIIKHPNWSSGNRMIAIPMTDFLRLLVCSSRKDKQTYDKYSHLLEKYHLKEDKIKCQLITQ